VSRNAVILRKAETPDEGNEMATLPVKVVPHEGLTLADSGYAPASAGGDQSATGSGILLLVKNGDTAAHTVTLAVPQLVDGLAVSPRQVEVPAGETGFIPLLNLYKDPATGLASWTYNGVSDMGVTVVRVA
jgi:hypothetical protein